MNKSKFNDDPFQDIDSGSKFAYAPRVTAMRKK